MYTAHFQWRPDTIGKTASPSMLTTGLPSRKPW